MRRAETPDRRHSSQHPIQVSFETSGQNPTSTERTSESSGARVTYWSPSGSQKSFSTGTDPGSFLISPPTSLVSGSNSQYKTESHLGEQSTCSCMNYGRAHQKMSRRGQLASHTPYARTRRHSRSQNDGWDRIGNEEWRCKTDVQDKRSENTENSRGCRCNTDMSRSHAGSDCKTPSHRKHYPWNDSDRLVQSNTPSQDNSMTREHNQTVGRDCQPQRTKASCSCVNQGQRIDPPPKSEEGCVVGRQMVDPCQCGGRCSQRNSGCDFYNTSTDASFPMADRSQTSSYLNHDSGTFQQNVGGNESDAREKCDGNLKCPSCSEKYPQGSQRRPCERSRYAFESEDQSCYCSDTEGNKTYRTLYPRQSLDKNNENSQASMESQRKPYN